MIFKMVSKPNPESSNEDDIESNLLKPPGIDLRPATFVLKVFRSEDIPRSILIKNLFIIC